MLTYAGAVAGYMWVYGAYHYFTRAHPAAHYDALASSVYFGYEALNN